MGICVQWGSEGSSEVEGPDLWFSAHSPFSALFLDSRSFVLTAFITVSQSIARTTLVFVPSQAAAFAAAIDTALAPTATTVATAISSMHSAMHSSSVMTADLVRLATRCQGLVFGRKDPRASCS